jgi:hypothetical protein
MVGPAKFPLLYRVRGKSGTHEGMWLWAMSVSENGLPISSPNWPIILQRPSGYRFRADFRAEESAAMSIFTKEVAEGYVRVLASQGIDAEVIES